MGKPVSAPPPGNNGAIEIIFAKYYDELAIADIELCRAKVFCFKYLQRLCTCEDVRFELISPERRTAYGI